jgi:hypothetical protein
MQDEQFKKKQKGYYNMGKRENLDKIVGGLNSFRPEFDDKAQIIRSVMEATSKSYSRPFLNRIIELLFGWTDSLWARRGFAAISMTAVFVFVLQQFIIVDRIGQLENRMVESNTEQIVKQQGDNVLFNSTFMSDVQEDNIRDSIMVSDKDLFALINSYNELQRQYQDLKRDHYLQRLNQEIKN